MMLSCRQSEVQTMGRTGGHGPAWRRNRLESSFMLPTRPPRKTPEDLSICDTLERHGQPGRCQYKADSRTTPRNFSSRWWGAWLADEKSTVHRARDHWFFCQSDKASRGGRLIGLSAAKFLGTTMVIRRRVLLAFPALALQAPLAVQPEVLERKRRIGVLVPSQAPVFAHLLGAFDRGLRERGWVNGQNVQVDIRSSDGSDYNFQRLAAELVGAKPDVIVSVTVPAIRAAQAATKTIPIVMLLSSDPVQLGLIDSLSRPGGNTTGLASNIQDLVPKRLELLREVVPGLAHASILWNPANPAMVAEWNLAKSTAESMRIGLQSVELKNAADLEAALSAIERSRPEALIVVADPLTVQLRDQVVAFATRKRLPTVYGTREMVEAGGLMSYGTNLLDQFLRVGYYVDRLLKGVSPADLPVEQPTKLDVVVNAKSAEMIGLSLPQSLFIKANETLR